MTKNELIRSLHNPVFADRDTINEAYNYAYDVLKGEGCDPVFVVTALQVLMNTIAKQVTDLEN